jgi:hypothetical protein
MRKLEEFQSWHIRHYNLDKFLPIKLELMDEEFYFTMSNMSI